MTIKDKKQALTTMKCFNYVSQLTFRDIKDVVDRMQVIHDVAMMLEGYILMNSKPEFVPRAMKDIERDIKKWIKFHNEYEEKK